MKVNFRQNEKMLKKLARETENVIPLQCTIKLSHYDKY